MRMYIYLYNIFRWYKDKMDMVIFCKIVNIYKCEGLYCEVFLIEDRELIFSFSFGLCFVFLFGKSG